MSLLLRCLMEVRAKAGEFDLLPFPVALAHLPAAAESMRLQLRFGSSRAPAGSHVPPAPLLGRPELQGQRFHRPHTCARLSDLADQVPPSAVDAPTRGANRRCSRGRKRGAAARRSVQSSVTSTASVLRHRGQGHHGRCPADAARLGDVYRWRTGPLPFRGQRQSADAGTRYRLAVREPPSAGLRRDHAARSWPHRDAAHVVAPPCPKSAWPFAS